MPTVEAHSLSRDYPMGTEAVHALKEVSLDIQGGTFVSVMGPSGSGKSTLLHLMGGLDRPTHGTVSIEGQDLSQLNDEQLTALRRRKLGFIFQFFNLLPTMTAWENVALPKMLDGKRLKDTKDRSVELLERVGLADRIDHKPAQLSGGEMQRVAIARALVAGPVLLLADEPTGNLDSTTGAEVLDLLKSLVRQERTTIVLVTHDARLAAAGDRVISLQDGKIVADESTSPASP